jgi:hypothetical protein
MAMDYNFDLSAQFAQEFAQELIAAIPKFLKDWVVYRYKWDEDSYETEFCIHNPKSISTCFNLWVGCGGLSEVSVLIERCSGAPGAISRIIDSHEMAVCLSDPACFDKLLVKILEHLRECEFKYGLSILSKLDAPYLNT